jgi:hypothetical protein
MNKHLKYTILSFVLAFVDLWGGFFLMKIFEFSRGDIMVVPALVTVIFGFVFLMAAAIINFVEYSCK